METQSNNKKVRTDFVNSLPKKKLTKTQIKKLWKSTRHYLVKTPDGVWNTKTENYVTGFVDSIIKCDFTNRKKKGFHRSYEWITLLNVVKGNIVLSQYRVVFKYNYKTMKVEYEHEDILDVNVWFHDKPKMIMYSAWGGYNCIRDKLTERACNSMYVHHDINQQPDIVKQSMFKGTKFEYLDMTSGNLSPRINFHNLSLLEKAQKEGWEWIALQTKKGKSLPEQFELPRFSKKEIWAMVEFYKNKKEFNLNIYKDYIELGYKLKKRFGPHRYLVDNYQELHDRYVAEKRRLKASEEKKTFIKKSIAISWWEKHKSDIKAKDIVVNGITSPKDLEKFGKHMANCMGVLHKKWQNDYAVQVKKEWVAVYWDGKNDWEILGYKNLSLPKIVIPKIKRKVMRFASA